MLVNCAECGKPLERSLCRVKKFKNQFCNRKCKRKWQLGKNRGENNPQFVARIKVYCAECGKPLERIPSIANKRNKKHFCNRKCFLETIQSLPVARIEIYCAECGKPLERIPCIANKRNKKHFCDRECYLKWKSKRRKSPDEIRNRKLERLRRYNPKYYQEHKEKIQKCHKEYSETPQGRIVAIRGRVRRSARLANSQNNDLTAEQLQRLFEKAVRCPICGRKFGKKVRKSHDHIKALSRGGSNTLTNSQIICRNCNSRKHARDYTEFTNGQLLMFL